MIFHLYFRILAFSALQSKHGSREGSRCPQGTTEGLDTALDLGSKVDRILEISMIVKKWCV